VAVTNGSKRNAIRARWGIASERKKRFWMAMGFGGGAAGGNDVAMISGNIDGKEWEGA